MAAAALALVGAVAGAVVSCGTDSSEPERPPVRTQGAQQVVDSIAAKWPLPNPRDTSEGCRAKDGDTAKGCESRVTTDAVTVIEYADETTAKQAAATLGKVADARQAGTYVLSWTDDQDLTSDEARADMVRIAAAQS